MKKDWFKKYFRFCSVKKNFLKILRKNNKKLKIMQVKISNKKHIKFCYQLFTQLKYFQKDSNLFRFKK